MQKSISKLIFQATQAEKIQFEIDYIKIQFELAFSNLYFQKLSTDQQGVRWKDATVNAVMYQNKCYMDSFCSTFVCHLRMLWIRIVCLNFVQILSPYLYIKQKMPLRQFPVMWRSKNNTKTYHERVLTFEPNLKVL